MTVVVGKSNQPNSGSTALEEDTVFDLLGNERRRASLKQLLTSEDETPVGELARDVAERITDESTVSEDLQRSVYISLCQSHLPKLDKAAIVEYDSDVKTVRRGPAFEQVKPYLETQPSTGREWLYYTVTSVLTVLLLAVLVANASIVRPYVTQLLLVVHLGMTAFGVSHLFVD